MEKSFDIHLEYNCYVVHRCKFHPLESCEMKETAFTIPDVS